MKKLLLVFSLFFIFINPVNCQQVLKAGIEKEWTVDSAREEAFKNVVYQINIRDYSSIDPDLIENKEAIIKGLKNIKGKAITVFSNGGYGIKDGTIGYYYDDSGNLNGIELYDSENVYPGKSYKYSYPSGLLLHVAIKVKPRNSYDFKPDGTLLTYWIGDNCYYPDGSKAITRKTYEK